MPRYLVSIYRPDGFDPAMVDDAMRADIDVLNDDMVRAGVRVFVGGLHPAAKAIALKAQPSGDLLIADGPYLKAAEQVDGFWVLEVADAEEAAAWARKAGIACRASVEVRRFH